jgi:polyhydroxyalkanoate synthesis regulator phasin
MTAKAHEISLEAGSKMAGAMKDVINAAAGLAGFAIESARDLVQYMVRRGQMTQDEADKLLREAEEAQARRKPPEALPDESDAKPAAKKKVAVKAPESDVEPVTEPKKAPAKAAKSAATKAPAEKPAAKSGAAKKASAAKAPAKAQTKKPSSKKK